LTETGIVIAAYLIGSLSFAVIVSRAFGLPDPHSYGSGNPGATNVLRSGRKAAAVLTLLGDAGKGYLAVFLGQAAVLLYGAHSATVPAVALACFAGHLWPVFFDFRGGKGVATAAGILLAIDPWVGGGVVVAWLVIAGIFRISSFAAVVAAIFAPLWNLWLNGADLTAASVLAIALLLLYRHKANIRRLLAGEEGRIGRDSQGT
jgi:glycerol-3-phosphate acyltransferase PlsY